MSFNSSQTFRDKLASNPSQSNHNLTKERTSRYWNELANLVIKIEFAQDGSAQISIREPFSFDSDEDDSDEDDSDEDDSDEDDIREPFSFDSDEDVDNKFTISKKLLYSCPTISGLNPDNGCESEDKDLAREKRDKLNSERSKLTTDIIRFLQYLYSRAPWFYSKDSKDESRNMLLTANFTMLDRMKAEVISHARQDAHFLLAKIIQKLFILESDQIDKIYAFQTNNDEYLQSIQKVEITEDNGDNTKLFSIITRDVD